VLPAAGSEAQAERVAADDRAVVEYHFPVEVEVRGPQEPVPSQPFAEQGVADLARELAAG
jgi:hypothetical protein